MLLAGNREMLDLIRELAPIRVVDRPLGTVELEVPVDAVGLAPELRKLLDLAARHDVAVPLAQPSRSAESPGADDGIAQPEAPIRGST